MATTKIMDLKKGQTLNPNKEPLTIEKLKTFKGFENLSEKEATETVFAIQTLANILYEFMNGRSMQSKPATEIINLNTKQAA